MIDEIKKEIYNNIFNKIFNRTLGEQKLLEYSDILELINETNLEKYKDIDKYKQMWNELKEYTYREDIIYMEQLEEKYGVGKE